MYNFSLSGINYRATKTVVGTMDTSRNDSFDDTQNKSGNDSMGSDHNLFFELSNNLKNTAVNFGSLARGRVKDFCQFENRDAYTHLSYLFI